MKFHLTIVKIVKLNDTSDSSCWQGCGIMETFIIAIWRTNLYSHYGKKNGISSDVGSNLPQNKL